MAEVACQPSVLGGTVRGYSDAYLAYRRFIRQWRALNARHSAGIDSQFQSCLGCCGLQTASCRCFEGGECSVCNTVRLVTVYPLAGSLAVPYIVSFDVSRAFDNVDVAQLLLLVEPLLQQPRYLMVKYTEVSVPFTSCR